MQNRSGNRRLSNRRSWIATVAGLGLGALARGSEEPAGDEAAIAQVEDRAKAVGLNGFRVTRTAHYLGIGDAPDRYRQDALDVCEAVARDCLEHFKAKGFAVAEPAGRGVVVILAGDASYAKFLGVDRESAVGGIYDIEPNRLVTFDFRNTTAPADNLAARRNTVALVHEAVHHWTYNAGLLDRRADIPVCLSEGLAMYAEERPPTKAKVAPGAVNKGRVDGLRLLRQGAAWIPIAKLLVDDDLAGGAGDEMSQQIAYAEDWLLVYWLMKDRDRQAAFRTYLKVINGRRDPSKRPEDFRQAFGDIDRLDAALRQEANRLIKR